MPYKLQDGKILDKILIQEVLLGVDDKLFYPLDENDAVLLNRKNQLFGDKKFDFILFYNSRNIQRKRTSDIILAYRTFCDNLSKEESDKCLLILKTEPKLDAGTDLIAVKEALCKDYNVLFLPHPFSPQDMNILYNLADVTINISDSEGFGLGISESVLSGTPIIVNVTGGLQDQIGQTKDDGTPIEFDADFGSNSVGKYKKHGKWARCIWPSVSCLIGSIPTPYLFSDYSDWRLVAKKIMEWYLTPRETRKKYGLEGREWMIKNVSAKHMKTSFIDGMEFIFSHWTPPKKFGIYTEKDYVGNIMPNNGKSLGFEIPKINKEEILKELSEEL